MSKTKLPYEKPAGEYMLVPTEPTIEMLNAYDEARAATTMVTNGLETYNPHQSYWAMLAAAPKPPPFFECPDCAADLAIEGHVPGCPRPENPHTGPFIGDPQNPPDVA
jgi:hypothetical protein